MTGLHPVAVSLLGGARLEVAGATIDCAALGRRAVIVLARLALGGTSGASRAELADAVWGNVPPESWAPALRNVIAEVRRAIERAGVAPSISVETTASGYALRAPAGLEVDFWELHRLVDQARSVSEQDDYPFVAQLCAEVRSRTSQAVLPGGDEAWVEALRSQARQARLIAAELAVETALAVGDNAGAERLARQLVIEAPLRESAYRSLMEALRRTGNRAQAMAEYYTCRKMLAERLGVLPDSETEATYLEILAEERRQEAGAASPVPRLVAAGPPLLVSPPSPFVGRQGILEELIVRLAMAESGGALIVTVRGEPGIGKTRLAAELASVAHRRGLPVLYGRTDDHLSVPFGSWLHALHQGLTGLDGEYLQQHLGRHLEVLSALAPTLSDQPDLIGARPVAFDRAQITRSIVACLRLLVGGKGGLVVLDDAQWASEGEIEVVEALLVDPQASPMLVLVLHRDRGDRASLASLAGHPRVAHVELGPLCTGDLAKLVREERPECPENELLPVAVRLLRRSGGNPLLAWALLRSSQGDEGQPARPARVEQLVTDRLASLTTGCRRLLSVAAVAGLEFDPALVAVATGTDPPSAEAHLEAARDAGLLVEGGDGPATVAFRHGVVRERLLDELAPSERSLAHYLLGSALETNATGEPAPVVEVAYHLERGTSDDWSRSLRYGSTAARVAYDAGVYEDVVQLATRALAVLERAGDPSPGGRLDLQVLLGGALRALGHRRGDELLRGAFEAASAGADPVRMAEAALAFSTMGALGDEWALDEQLLDLYQQAADALGPGECRRRALLLARIAGGNAWRRDPAAAGRAAAKALRLARELGDARTTATVAATVRRSISSSGSPEERSRLEEELVGLAEELDEPGLKLSTSLWRFETAVQLGHGQELENLLKEAAEQSRTVTSGRFHHYSVAYEQAELALLRDRLEEAELLVERAARIGQGHGLDQGVVEAIRLSQLTVLRTEQGRLGELREQARRFFDESGVPSWLGFVAYIDAALERTEGVAQRVDVLIEDFARGPSGVCPPGFAAYMSRPVVKLAEPSRISRLHQLLEPFGGQGGSFACFAGPIDYHLGVLAHALGRRMEARRRFASARRFSARLGAPRWEARAAAALSATT